MISTIIICAIIWAAAVVMVLAFIKEATREYEDDH